jgi:hypothetical protein
MKSSGLREQRVFFTYSYLREASCFYIEQAKDFKGKPELISYYYMGAIMSSALCIEAYLNHIGERLFPHWEDIERLSPKGKLQVIAYQLNLSLNFSCRPFQSFTPLFQFRNLLAHGRTEEYEGERGVGEQDCTPDRPRWEQESTLKNAERFLEDVEAMILCIYKKIDDEAILSEGHPLEMMGYKVIKAKL